MSEPIQIPRGAHLGRVRTQVTPDPNEKKKKQPLHGAPVYMDVGDVTGPGRLFSYRFPVEGRVLGASVRIREIGGLSVDTAFVKVDVHLNDLYMVSLPLTYGENKADYLGDVNAGDRFEVLVKDPVVTLKGVEISFFFQAYA